MYAELAAQYRVPRVPFSWRRSRSTSLMRPTACTSAEHSRCCSTPPGRRCARCCRAGKTGEMLDKYWLKSYPADVPAEIDPTQYRSLKEFVEKNCARYAGRVVRDDGSRDELRRARPAIGRVRGGCSRRPEPAPARASRSCCRMCCNTRRDVRCAARGPHRRQRQPLYTPHELEHQISDSARRSSWCSRIAHVVAQALPDATRKCDRHIRARCSTA